MKKDFKNQLFLIVGTHSFPSMQLVGEYDPTSLHLLNLFFRKMEFPIVFFALCCLAITVIIIINGQTMQSGFFKQMRFPANWESKVYEIVNDIHTKIECVGLCLANIVVCNVVFYDPLERQCLLGNLSSNYSVLDVSNQSTLGYIDLGNFLT